VHPHVECVSAFEPEYDAILVVHAHRIEASTITREPVQPIPRRHVQVTEPYHRVDLIQFPANDGPRPHSR
jgi:hypothetical protein